MTHPDNGAMNAEHFAWPNELEFTPPQCRYCNEPLVINRSRRWWNRDMVGCAILDRHFDNLAYAAQIAPEGIV